MLTTLGYPRSGSTLVQFLLNNARPPVCTNKLHGHDIINEGIYAVNDDKLLMLIRNYKECIMSHLTRDDDQHDVTKIREAFKQYVTVLEVYEASTCKKNWCYYEDLIEHPYAIMGIIADYFDYNLEHVLADLDYYLEASKQDYIRKLGPQQTSGKEAIFFTPLTKYYDFDWDHEIYLLNPQLYDKYLKIYGDIND